MKKAIFVITLTLVALVSAGSAIGCTQKTTSLTGTWKINSGGYFDAGSSGNGTFGRDFIITVKQENTSLQGTGKDVSGGRTADVPGGEVVLNGEVKDGSKVTFTIHEDFPVKGGKADLVHEFTGAVSGGKITGTFQGGFDAFEIKYRINGTFVVSVDSAGSTTTPTITANTTTSTPTLPPSQPMDLTGTWSGTHIVTSSSPNKYNDINNYNLVITIRGQYGSQVVAQFSANSTSYYYNGALMPSGGAYAWPRTGDISGTTVTWQSGNDKIPGESLQVSGDSMTGSGGYTDADGTTRSWSYNLTRVP